MQELFSNSSQICVEGGPNNCR